ncbi:MAG: alpha/beta hydrolase, partial [Myxococcales bacterium]
MEALRPAALLVGALLAACAPTGPTEGAALRPGVAVATFVARTAGGEPFEVDVFFPADGERPSGEAHPALVLLPGGLVRRERYGWLGVELAARGFVVAVPEPPYRLAILDPNRVEATAALLRSGRGLLAGLVGERIAVAGHSLGGVVATAAALRGGFSALVLLASYPAEGDPVERLAVPSLSLAGERDCEAVQADVRAGWQRLPAPTALAVLSGVTH